MFHVSIENNSIIAKEMHIYHGNMDARVDGGLLAIGNGHAIETDNLKQMKRIDRRAIKRRKKTYSSSSRRKRSNGAQ